MLKYLKNKYDPIKYNCWQFVVDYYKQELNIDLFDYNKEVNGNSKSNQLHSFISNESKNWRKLEKPKQNCVLLISNTPPYIDHIAIYISKDSIIQNLENTGVVISKFSLWKHRIVGAYEYI